MKLIRIAPVVAVALLALTGCDQGGGTAATVNGEKISTSDVDLLSNITCDAASSGTQQGTPSVTPVSVVRMQALSALVNNDLAQQLAAKTGATYDKMQLLQAMTGIDDQLTTVAAADRAHVRDLVEQFNIGQLELISMGQKELVAGGEKAPTQQESLQEGYALVQKYADSIKIDIDPRFAPGSKANPGGGQRSLSTAVSSFAKQSDSLSPTQVWATSLPPNQKCG